MLYDRMINANISAHQTDESVKFIITATHNVDMIHITAQGSDGNIPMHPKRDARDVIVKGAQEYNIYGVSKSGEKQHLYTYTSNTNEAKRDGSGDIEISENSSLSVEQAIDRYVQGDTWVLGLEDELEIALTE